MPSNGASRKRRYGRRGEPYEHIILPGGERFDIPEGEDKEEWIEFFEEADRATQEINARWGDGRPPDGVKRASILPNSSHRDGSIYSDTESWHQEYRISDTTETQLEPMILSNPTRCYPNQESCGTHIPRPMIQIFSLKLATLRNWLQFQRTVVGVPFRYTDTSQRGTLETGYATMSLIGAGTIPSCWSQARLYR